MFIIKKKYFFYIDNIKLVNLNLIKKNSKIGFIYRPKYKIEPFKFRKHAGFYKYDPEGELMGYLE